MSANSLATPTGLPVSDSQGPFSEITVEAANIHKSYLLGSTAVGALRGVDLVVRRGEFVALMGPSGCGKTTLLNLMGAIDLPSRGTISIEGIDLQRLSDEASKRTRGDL